jgi:hypothetical protein
MPTRSVYVQKNRLEGQRAGRDHAWVAVIAPADSHYLALDADGPAALGQAPRPDLRTVYGARDGQLVLAASASRSATC